MDCLHEFDNDLKTVFDMCGNVISTYPHSFGNEGLEYLDRFNVFKNGSCKNYICYLLPFWINHDAQVDKSICRSISMGNTFQMLYFFILDDIMDAGRGEYKGNLLPLANLFFVDFLDAYRKLFPSDSPFWSYYREYFHDWSEGVTREKYAGSLEEKDLCIVSKKAAPLKLASTAICLLGGLHERIEKVSAAIDCVLVTLQLLDDLADWREDLSIKCSTYFLTEIMNRLGISDISLLNEQSVLKAIYTYDILDKVTAKAKSYAKDLAELTGSDFPYLKAFHHLLVKDLTEITSKLNEEKEAMMAGRFSYWLYKNRTQKEA